ncbi:MAG: hypothetical protein EHM58_03560 [Ignavibacteriae bacterium]|nr:MAG: hypothetical protein EHM58_03560 [Ignavibacteriota bacterium]
MKDFSCKYFFDNIDKNKVFKKYFVDTSIKPGPCKSDPGQNENKPEYSPEEHLIKVHGFLDKVPVKKRRTLEIQLCKFIELMLQNSN